MSNLFDYRITVNGEGNKVKFESRNAEEEIEVEIEAWMWGTEFLSLICLLNEQLPAKRLYKMMENENAQSV